MIYENYRKKALQPMRPVTQEDAQLVADGYLSVSPEDWGEFVGFLEGSNEGGMVAVNPDNHNDKWYVAKAFFEKNYEKALGGVHVP